MAKFYPPVPLPSDTLMRPIIKEFGFDGYGRFIAVLSYSLEQGSIDIDEFVLRNYTQCNLKGAVKFLPMFRETLPKVLANLHQCLPKVLANFDQTLIEHIVNIDQTLVKLGVQNPHGSTRVETNNTKKKTIQTTVVKTPVPLPEDFKLTPQLLDWALKNGLSQQEAEFETLQFVDRNIANGKLAIDWNRTWYTAMRNSVKWRDERAARQVTPPKKQEAWEAASAELDLIWKNSSVYNGELD